MLSLILSKLTPEQLAALVGLALVVLSVLLYQLELALRARGWARAAAALATVRGLIVDAPAVRARLLAALQGRASLPTIPEPAEPPKPEPPKAPPGITGVFLVLTILLSSGCALSPLDRAIVVANTADDVGKSVDPIVVACKRRWSEAPSKEAVASIDKECLPIAVGQLGLHTAYVGLRAGILVAKASGDATAIPALVGAVVEATKNVQAALAATTGGAK